MARTDAQQDLTTSPSPARGEVRAVVFDIGATLVTGPPVAPNKVIASLLKDAAPKDVAGVIMTRPLESALAVREAIEAQFGPVDDAAADKIAELWGSQTGAAQELEGATEAVLALKNSGLRIGLLSDIWSPYYASVSKAIPRVIEAADAIVLSCETGRRKPAPHNFLRVLAELQTDPEATMMVGDTYEHDILPAIELGLRTMWVLARPDREIQSVIGVLNGRYPKPSRVVGCIGEVAREVEIWRSSELNGIQSRN